MVHGCIWQWGSHRKHHHFPRLCPKSWWGSIGSSRNKMWYHSRNKELHGWVFRQKEVRAGETILVRILSLWKNSWHKQLKRTGYSFWLMVTEVSVHNPGAPLILGPWWDRVSCIENIWQATHLVADGKPRKKRLELRYNFKRLVAWDITSSSQAPPPPTIMSAAGTKNSIPKPVKNGSYSSQEIITFEASQEILYWNNEFEVGLGGENRSTSKDHKVTHGLASV